MREVVHRPGLYSAFLPPYSNKAWPMGKSSDILEDRVQLLYIRVKVITIGCRILSWVHSTLSPNITSLVFFSEGDVISNSNRSKSCFAVWHSQLYWQPTPPDHLRQLQQVPVPPSVSVIVSGLSVALVYGSLAWVRLPQGNCGYYQ